MRCAMKSAPRGHAPVVMSLFLVALASLTAVGVASAQPAASAPVVSSSPACPAGNLLAGKLPLQTSDRRGRLPRITDGIAANEGAVWDATLAHVFETGASTVTYDLGQVVTLQALWVQADANDYYTVWGSLDGQTWKDLGRVDTAEGMHGLRGRSLSLGGAVARYFRFGEGEGDGFYSVSELQLFCSLPTPFPPKLRTVNAPALPVTKNFFSYWNDRASMWWELVLALMGLALLYWGFSLRREGRAGAHRKLRDRLLMALGAISALTYVNLGFFHFGNFTHDWEWTHYYVGSKYFDELSYDRLYECIAIADVESGLAKRVEKRKLTNLRTNYLESSKDVIAHPERCKQHFSAGRWKDFKQDVAFFRNRQNAKRWDDLQTDHGYNGTPVWNVAGTLLANTGPASKVQLYTLAMLDPLYLLATWGVIWWAFGWRTLCVALLVFATNFPSRFYWTGGAYLRWDWLFYLTAGICCLRKDRPMLGGAALAYSTLLRVFPAFIFAGPLLGLGYHFWRKRKLDPASAEGRRSSVLVHTYTRFVLGAALATALLVPLSLGVSGGVHAYQRFVQNTAKHKETPLTNYMGLRTVMAYRVGEAGRDLKDDKLTDPWLKWKQARLDGWKSARPIYVVVVLGFLALLGLAVRKVEPWAAAAMGVTVIPVGVELTCYYYAFIIGVALLYEKREDAGWWLLLLTAFTTFVALAPFRGMSGWLDEQYTVMSLATVGVFAYLLWLFHKQPDGLETLDPSSGAAATAVAGATAETAAQARKSKGHDSSGKHGRRR
jgi:hypothetical protein